jgi:hypothetical protein
VSYARWGWEGSNVYVYMHPGGLECCGCDFDGGCSAATTDAMVAHLRRHMAAGDCVPTSVIPDLLRDRDENDAHTRAAHESAT